MTSTKPRSSFLIESLLFEPKTSDEDIDDMKYRNKRDTVLPQSNGLLNSCCKTAELDNSSRLKASKLGQSSKNLSLTNTTQQEFQRILSNLADCRQEPSYSAALPQYQKTAVQNTLEALTLSSYFKKYDILQQAVSLQWGGACALNTPALRQSLNGTVQSPYSLTKHIVKEHHRRMRNVNGNSDNGTNIKKYRCDICDKTFSRSNTLITHKRIHTGEKPFECDHCGRAFRQPGNLTRHRLTHTTVKPYICSFCDKAFNRASNLHTHIRTHGIVSQRNI